MSAAGTSARLPEEVVERRSSHFGYRFAANDFRLWACNTPGRAALEFARAYGGKEIATVGAVQDCFGGPIDRLCERSACALHETSPTRMALLAHIPWCPRFPAGFASGEHYEIELSAF